MASPLDTLRVSLEVATIHLSHLGFEEQSLREPECQPPSSPDALGRKAVPRSCAFLPIMPWARPPAKSQGFPLLCPVTVSPMLCPA
jgi:hypothetical protein